MRTWIWTMAGAAALGGCIPAATADQGGPSGQTPPVTSFPGAGEAEGEAACRAAVALASGRADVAVVSSQLTHVGRQVTLTVGGERWSCVAGADGTVFDVIKVGG